MTFYRVAGIFLLAVITFIGCKRRDVVGPLGVLTPVPTPTLAPVPTSTQTPVFSLTRTATVTPSFTQTPSSVPSSTVTETLTSTQTPTFTGTHTPVPGVSFSADVQPIFNSFCTGCHGTSGGLTLTAGVSHGELFNVVEEASPGCTGQFRAEPFNSAASVLYLRVSSSACGPQMPKFSPALSPGQIQTIQDWIDQGALNN